MSGNASYTLCNRRREKSRDPTSYMSHRLRLRRQASDVIRPLHRRNSSHLRQGHPSMAVQTTDHANQRCKVSMSKREQSPSAVAEPCITPSDPWPRPYYFEDGLRKVLPYHYTYNTFCKERWRGRQLMDIFESEFRDRPTAYYVRLAQG